jgi:uncharacterized membrane protein YkgB
LKFNIPSSNIGGIIAFVCIVVILSLAFTITLRESYMEEDERRYNNFGSRLIAKDPLVYNTATSTFALAMIPIISIPLYL